LLLHACCFIFVTYIHQRKQSDNYDKLARKITLIKSILKIHSNLADVATTWKKNSQIVTVESKVFQGEIVSQHFINDKKFFFHVFAELHS